VKLASVFILVIKVNIVSKKIKTTQESAKEKVKSTPDFTHKRWQPKLRF
jgi:hypothetical protein